jgi:DNA invertase Pin-like site-specific DNA recombinase
MLVGYARTSTTDQKAGLDAQERDLRVAGAERVFAEQVSSVAQRGSLKACLEFMREGDVLVVTKPDRLARSTAELLAIEADLSRHGIGLLVLSMGGERLDTRNPTSKLMLTILGGVATWEREIMLERQREGIARAKGEGKYKGRKPTVAIQSASTECSRVRRYHSRVAFRSEGERKVLMGPSRAAPVGHPARPYRKARSGVEYGVLTSIVWSDATLPGGRSSDLLVPIAH